MNTQELTAALRAKGLRPTPQRLAIYRYLIEHPTHPTADTLFRALESEFPAFSRTTVYNTVHALTEAGLVAVLTMTAGEQRFDATVCPHGHFRCTRCGRIFDFPLPADTAAALIPTEYAVDSYTLCADGICADCREK